jgi:hypothetical protein
LPDPDGPRIATLLVLLAYHLSGAAFLTFSSIAERSGRRLDDGRSLSFLGGLAEGTETVVVHALWLLFPDLAGPIAASGRWSSCSARASGWGRLPVAEGS